MIMTVAMLMMVMMMTTLGGAMTMAVRGLMHATSATQGFSPIKFLTLPLNLKNSLLTVVPDVVGELHEAEDVFLQGLSACDMTTKKKKKRKGSKQRSGMKLKVSVTATSCSYTAIFGRVEKCKKYRKGG